jgi:hypothetical protein
VVVTESPMETRGAVEVSVATSQHCSGLVGIQVGVQGLRVVGSGWV